MRLMLLVELGMAAAILRQLASAARALRAAMATFDALKAVPYYAHYGDVGWRSPLDVALNDELYPRTFGPVWPSERVPYATFLEENFATFRADLEGILSEDGLFEHLRSLDRNAEGIAVWPPDTRGHVELVDFREDPPFKAACRTARASCALLASRPEISGCPRAAAFFVRLDPGAWLKPHLGNMRRLAAHLGLVIPDGPVELNVGPSRGLRWEEGRAVVWDDTHLHDARHSGFNGTRFILQTFFCLPCEQRELYNRSDSALVRQLVAYEACIHRDPGRAEISRALRAEMDEQERLMKAAPKMAARPWAPIGV